jgi:DNA-binding response OmpR family regulator
VGLQHTILLVEDDYDARAIYSMAMSIAGFRVVLATDGMMALALLEVERPDLVVLDLFLPTVSGFVVHDEIAAREDLRSVPVVVVTAATREQVRHLFVERVLHKPVLPTELVDTVRECIARKIN